MKKIVQRKVAPRIIVQRKRRNGSWYSMGQGSGNADTGGKGADSGGNDDDAGDDDGLDDDDADDDDAGDDDKGKGKAKAKTGDDPEKARLIAENKRRRQLAKTAITERDQVRQELDAIKNKDKPEVDRLKAENEALKAKIDGHANGEKSHAVMSSFRLAAIRQGIQPGQLEFAEFKFNKAASDLEADSDDLDSEVEAIVKTLIKDSPILTQKRRAKAESNDDDDEDDDDDDGQDSGANSNNRSMGRTAPAMNNGRKKPGRETDQEKAQRLAVKFPALQGRTR